jgi:phosphatidylglycerol lysyltransferase
MTAKPASFVFQRKAFVQFFATCLVLPLCALAALPVLETLDWGEVGQSWSGITPLQWSLAILATAASFAALGQYDVIVHRILNTRISARAAQASGAAAVALSQTLGFGLIVGTLARWRGLHRLDIAVASKVTALVSISFLGAWLTLFALAGLLLPHGLPVPSYVFQASLFSAACFTFYTALKRHITVAGYRTRLPSLRAIFALMCFALIDTGFAALAFWVLIPSSADILFAQLFPIYLICLGVALVSNTPGGVGPFELTLLWAIPDTNINELLAALIAFRLVYFALPASLGMLYMFRPLNDQTEVSRVALFARGLHPETSSALQTGATLITPNGQIIGATARTTQSTTLLFEPAAKLQSSLTALSLQASTSATIPLFYKCNARTALQLRAHGLSVVRIAQDGLIDLKDAKLETPQRRTLRRKLRKIEKSGVEVNKLTLTKETISTLDRIDRDWHGINGTPRGLSMGRFCEAYLTTQDVFGASQNDRLIAFISCHKTSEAWTLDLMRSSADASDGTMHALVWAAIKAAKNQQCKTFSLASTPYEEAFVLKAVEKISFLSPPHSKGLAQFKRAFAPRWQPLYAAAPSRMGLFLALWDVWHEVNDPPPLREE